MEEQRRIDRSHRDNRDAAMASIHTKGHHQNLRQHQLVGERAADDDTPATAVRAQRHKPAE
jgi:hypothetical protein